MDRRPHLPFSTDLILESLPEGFQAFDREWRYVYLNQRAEQILGRRREELLGKVCWEEYPEAVGTPFHQKYLKAVQTGQSVVFEFFCPHENQWAEFSLHPYPGGLGAFTRDITERKQAEEALQASLQSLGQSEQQYRALFDQVRNAVVLADDSGRYLDANPAACTLFGLSREQLAGRSILDFAPPGTGAQVKEAWREFLRSGDQSGEFLLHRPDGTLRILEYHAKTSVRPGVHLSILQDVTERRRAQERAASLLTDLQEERDTLDTINSIGRLLSAELNLDRLVQAATDAATDLTGAQFGAFFYNNVNEAGESYLLYTISGAPREAFSQFPHPRATPLFGVTFRAEGIVRSGDISRDPRYGKMGPHHGMPPGHLPVRSYLAVPVVSRSGEVLGGLFFGHEEPDVFTEGAERKLVALVAQIAVAMDNARLFGQAQRDLEERKRAEQALRASEERFRTAANLATDHIYEWDKATGQVQWFTDLAGWLGYTKEELPAFLQVLHPDDRERLKAALAHALETGQGYQEEVRFVAKDGSIRYVIDHATVLKDSRLPGNPVKVIGVNTDVTERKRAEQTIREAALVQRRFLREMLFSMTEARLRLCDTPADLPAPFDLAFEPVELSRRTLKRFRQQIEAAMDTVGMPKERRYDLMTGASEAAMNAVVHAGSGTGSVHVDRAAGSVQVWVGDTGGGITEDAIHKATLERGWTTTGTLGHGFWMMLKTCDRIYLLTGKEGTTVVLEQETSEPQPAWTTRG